MVDTMNGSPKTVPIPTSRAPWYRDTIITMASGIEVKRGLTTEPRNDEDNEKRDPIPSAPSVKR